MKTPLSLQITEYDCGPLTLHNAINYLFDRKEIPVEVIKKIYYYTLDIDDTNGNLCHGGTSKEAVAKFVAWLNDYAKRMNLNIICERLTGKNITVQKMKNCINKGGCVCARCWQESEHYVLITNINATNVFLFDPYYLDKYAFDNDNEVNMVFDKPFSHNRIVTLKRLLEETKNDFSLGTVEDRECILFNKFL